MCGATPSLPNTPSWRGVQLKKQGQLYLYLFLLVDFGSVQKSCLIYVFRTVSFLNCDQLRNVLPRVLLEKLTVTQLVKKFPAFYGTRRFITVFTGPF
jgi:hypothetical protein